MTLGDKLAKLRRENNYTQEQLADILGVSRQSVSKWESDLAYPETEKLLRLGKLYGCSMDHLLKDEAERTQERERKGRLDLRSYYFERKSKLTVGKLPLWHINIGLGRTAKGVFAIGLCAKGIVSVGLLSLGILSFGTFSLGLLAFGAWSLGLIAAGAISLGIIAFGAICIGIVSVGAISIGAFSFGALSIGNYLAVGDYARGAIAIGKTQAIGPLYEAAALTAENRSIVLELLDERIPALLVWAKALVKLFL